MKVARSGLMKRKKENKGFQAMVSARMSYEGGLAYTYAIEMQHIIVTVISTLPSPQQIPRPPSCPEIMPTKFLPTHGRPSTSRDRISCHNETFV